MSKEGKHRKSTEQKYARSDPGNDGINCQGKKNKRTNMKDTKKKKSMNSQNSVASMKGWRRIKKGRQATVQKELKNVFWHP